MNKWMTGGSEFKTQKKNQVPSVINVGFRKSYLKVYLKGICLIMSAIYRLIPSVKFCREKDIILGSRNSKQG